MDSDRLLGLVPTFEVVALEHAGHRVLGGETHDRLAVEFVEPGAIERHFGLFRIEDLENLLLVGLGVLFDLRSGQLRTRLRLSTWVADEARKISNEKVNDVSEILEVLHLPNDYGVAQMYVRRGRIETNFYFERLSCFRRFCKFRPELFYLHHIHRPLGEIDNLFVDGELLQGLFVLPHPSPLPEGEGELRSSMRQTAFG